VKLVVDTNIVFSLYKHDSFVKELIRTQSLQLYAPEFVRDELQKYSGLILRYI